MAQPVPQQQDMPAGVPPKKKSKGMGFWGVLLTTFLVSLVISIVSGRYILPWLDGILKQKVEVPSVRGVRVEHAKLVLESRGLFMTVMGEAHDDEISAGDVASQTPLSGSMVDKKSTVTLVISKGKPKVRIPVLLQLPEEEAKAQLTALGLTVGAAETKQSPSVPMGRIISSDPRYGTEVDKGTAVNLVVSEGMKVVKPVKVTVPGVKGKTIDEAQKILSSKGLVLGKISKKTDENADFDIILEQSPSAGASAVKGSAVSVTINAESGEE